MPGGTYLPSHSQAASFPLYSKGIIFVIGRKVRQKVLTEINPQEIGEEEALINTNLVKDFKYKWNLTACIVPFPPQWDPQGHILRIR